MKLKSLQWSKRLSLSLSLLFVLTGCSTLSGSPPEHLYEQVWQAVSDDFVDVTYNHQDWQYWRHHYDGKLQTMDDAYIAIDTMLASLNDDYTRLLRPRDMQEQTMHIDAKLFGVGLQITVKDKQLKVVSPLDGTPADKAGLKPNDVITTINGVATQGMAVEDAANLIRGKKGTVVTLKILRQQQYMSARLVRDEIKLKSVFTKPLDNAPDIGYVRLSTFISETAEPEIEQALKSVSTKKALVLDLRGNYGGLLTNAVSIADLFLDSGHIVSIENRDHQTQYLDAHEGELFRGPMVLLIDHGSASASEILSGAMKDHHRATLVGTQSFGKGLVQKVMPLSSSAGLNMTVSRYRTPNGTDIHTKGIHPDKVVDWTDQDIRANRDPQLDAAIGILKAKIG